MFHTLPDSRKAYYKTNAEARRLRMKPTPETKEETRARLLDILINLLNRLKTLGLSVEYKRISGGFTIKILGTDLVPIGDTKNTGKPVE